MANPVQDGSTLAASGPDGERPTPRPITHGMPALRCQNITGSVPTPPVAARLSTIDEVSSPTAQGFDTDNHPRPSSSGKSPSTDAAVQEILKLQTRLARLKRGQFPPNVVARKLDYLEQAMEDICSQLTGAPAPLVNPAYLDAQEGIFSSPSDEPDLDPVCPR